MKPLKGVFYEKIRTLKYGAHFLKDKSSFHLKDLMVEFNISKSTAIRDIKALEEMGLALYVENGRFGGYKIVSENLLTPIYFNNNEMLAIFYALKSMSALTTTPFEKRMLNLVKNCPQQYRQI